MAGFAGFGAGTGAASAASTGINVAGASTANFAGAAGGGIGVTGTLGLVGLGVSILGGILDSKAQEADARRNAIWLREQASHFRMVTERQKDVFNIQADRVKGAQKVSVAGSGVSLEGSFIEMEEQTEMIRDSELAAIEFTGAFKIKEALQQADAYEKRAEQLGSFEHFGLSILGSILGAPVTADVVSGKFVKRSGETGTPSGAFASQKGIRNPLPGMGKDAAKIFRAITPGREKDNRLFKLE